jgi:hypothetical protein
LRERKKERKKSATLFDIGWNTKEKVKKKDSYEP